MEFKDFFSLFTLALAVLANITLIRKERKDDRIMLLVVLGWTYGSWMIIGSHLDLEYGFIFFDVGILIFITSSWLISELMDNGLVDYVLEKSIALNFLAMIIGLTIGGIA